MSWEAYRWTAKSPSELFHTLGPHGVDHLVRQSFDTCWRELPEDRRTFADVRRVAEEVFDRNVKVWRGIKQPSPAAFFDHLLPQAADGFMRQAMVMAWMMMPRTGGRKVSDALKIITEIFNRNMEAWEQDNATFTGQPRKRVAKAGGKSAGKAKAAKVAKVAKVAKPKTAKAAAKRPAAGKKKAMAGR